MKKVSMKAFAILLLASLIPSARAADNIIGDGKSGDYQLIDNSGNRWNAGLGYTTNGSGDVITLGGLSASSDNIIGDQLSGNHQLVDNAAKRWNVQVFYTTDGHGNVIPVTGGGGGVTFSLAPVGSTPNATGATYNGGTGVFALQPGDGTHPGVITSDAEDIGGVKNFLMSPTLPASLPTLANQAASKAYVDLSITTGSRFVGAVDAMTTAALPAVTYANGASGVGATLTENANGAFPTIDGFAPVVNKLYLIKDQAAQLQNGAYTLTTVGDAGTPFVLTRPTTYDESSQIVAGTFFSALNGTVNKNSQWSMVTTGTVTVGTTAIVFNQLSAPQTYTASLGVKLSGTDFESDLAANQGLAVTGNSLKVDYDNATLGIVANKLAIKAAGVAAGNVALTDAHLLVGVSGTAADLAVSGDVTLANTGAFTVANSAITNAKMANMADQRFKGNVSGGSAAPSDLTVAQMKTALGLTGSNTGDVTLGATAISGGMTLAGQVLSMAQASGSQNGWLSSSDWLNFSTTVQQSQTVKNINAGTINKGQAVYITGYDVGTGAPTVDLARANATSTMPTIGLVSSASIASGATGTIQVAGVMTGFDTSALTVGQVAYVSPTTAGGLTSTYPTIVAGQHNVAEMVGVVIRSDATLGQMYIVAQQPDQLQNGTIADAFFIGSGSAGAKTVVFNTGASTAGTLTWTPTATRTMTIPDTTGTLLVAGFSQSVTSKFMSGDVNPVYFTANGDSTKRLTFDESGATNSTTLTITDTQSTSKSLAIPNLSANAAFVVSTGATNTITGTTTVDDGAFSVRNATNTTDTIKFRVDTSASRILTIAGGVQTASRVLSVPVLAADDTLVVAGLNPSFGAGSGSPTITLNGVHLGIITDASLSGDRTWTFPNLTGTVALTNAAQTFTGVQNFSDGASGFAIRNTGDTTKEIEFDASGNTTGIVTTIKAQSSSANTYSLPALGVNDTLISRTSTDTLTNKTLTTPVISSISNSGTVTIPTGTDTLVNLAGTSTLTNKRITKRVVAGGTLGSSGATVTITSDTADLYTITQFAAGTAVTIGAPSGTPTDGQPLEFVFTNSTNATTYTFNAAFVGSTSLALPTTATANKKDRMVFQWDAGTSKWLIIGLLQGF